jgi:hypothetical protein
VKASSQQFSSTMAASYELVFILPNGAAQFYLKRENDRFLRNVPTYLPSYKCHNEEEQLEDRRNVDENSCNSGDRTDQRVQSLMFMMMTTVNVTSQKTIGVN